MKSIAAKKYGIKVLLFVLFLIVGAVLVRL